LNSRAKKPQLTSSSTTRTARTARRTPSLTPWTSTFRIHTHGNL
jgi:hypothetical protein